MAKLIFVQQRRSIFRCVMFAVFLELTIISKCASSQKICIPGSRRDVSYVNVGYNDQVDWNTARQKCIAENSTLPVICNNDEEDALVAHLKGSIRTSAAWTSGKLIFTNWTWIDGKPFTGFISPAHKDYTHIAFDKSQNNYKAANPWFPNYYLCKYSGSLCNSENVINVTNGCIRPSGDGHQTWLDARIQCITNGSDLAILADDDLDTLKRSNKVYLNRSYWIGLRKSTTWHWMWLITEQSSEDITYTNWSGVLNRREDECLSIDASNGEWKAVRCTDRKIFVCERSYVVSENSRSLAFGSDATTISSDATQAMTSIGLGLGLPMSESVTCDVLKVLLIAVVVVGLCVIIISNIIVALVVRKYIYRRLNASSNSAATETKCYQDLETTQRQANPDGTYAELHLQPVYEEVSQRGK